VPSASGVFAFEVGAEALLLRGALDKRSEMLARARKLAFSRMAPSWDGEKDHSRNWEDCRYRASSVAMAGAVEGGCLAIREGGFVEFRWSSTESQHSVGETGQSVPEDVEVRGSEDLSEPIASLK